MGVDPSKKVAHFYIKTGMGESKKTIPLSPLLTYYLEMLKTVIIGGVL